MILPFVVAFVFFCNGSVWALTELKREMGEVPFFVEWNNLVEEYQDKKIGRVMVKIFYFIPSLAALISKKRAFAKALFRI